MAAVGPFLVIILPTVLLSFTKLRFRWSFWCALQVKILISSKVMTQNVPWGWARSWLNQRLIIKFTSDKWPFYDHFWPFLCQLYENISQNWGSDGHFEALNKSESWHKTHTKPKTQKEQMFFFYNIAKKRKWKYLHFES